MNTLSQLIAITLTSGILLSATAKAATLWDVQTPSAAGVWSELAKEGLVSDNAGNTFSIGYRNANSLNGADAVIYKRNAAGALLGTGAYHPVVGDSYFYTGVAIDPGAGVLVVTGTHFIAATRSYEWFVNRLDIISLAPLAGWNAGLGRTFTPASVGRAADAWSYSGRVTLAGGFAYVSGSTNRSIVALKLQLASGLVSGTWAAAGPQPVGVRHIAASGCAVHSMPGNTGGIFANIPQSFVEVQGANVLLAGSLDFGAGARFDSVLQSLTQAAGAVNWGNTFNNAGQDDVIKAIAVGNNGIYLSGDTLGGANSAFLQGYTLAGAAIAGVPLYGPVGSNACDVEALNVAGVDHIYVGGHQPAGGVITHYERAGAGVVVSGAWANAAYGAGPADQVNDIAIGTAGAFVNKVYATGKLFDGGVGMDRATEMSVTIAGVIAFNAGIATPTARGNAAHFNSAIGTVFTHGNGIAGAGNALIEDARFTP